MSRINSKSPSVYLLSGTFMLTLLLMGGTAHQAGAAEVQAQDLLTKMNALYAVAAYQGVATLTQKGMSEDNKPYVVKGTQEVSYKSPNLFLIKSTGEAAGGTQVRIFDGKQIINYNSGQKQYMKRPMKSAGNANAPLPLLSLFGLSVDAQSGKMAGSAVVGGKAAYLVQATAPFPALGASASAQDKANREEFRKTLPAFELAIDKKDYRLLRVVQTYKEAKMTRTLEFTQQTFNPVLGENAFVFAPPAGSQSQQAALKAAFSKGQNGGNGTTALVPGRSSSASQGGGNPLPPPHASPGVGGTNPRP